MSKTPKSYVSIKENREFQLLFKKGNSRVTRGFVCYYRVNDMSFNRLGLVASKKVGNAVKRNRAKRVIREAFRRLIASRQGLNAEIAAPCYDFVFVARGKTTEMKSTEVEMDMGQVFNQI